ncbi:MAG: ATP-grasp fold amidoligase family protein, partial [Desulfohalobiaceae bacterium]
MWLSPMCCLDRRGGAAQQMRSVLATLASAGWQAYGVQMTLFDGQEEYPISTLVGKQNAVPENYGKTFNLQQDGVQHLLFYTQNSHKRTQEESKAFFQRAVKALHEIKPDVVIAYGSSKLLQSLVREARKVCRSLIFYLANPSYSDPELFWPFDLVLTNSNFMVKYYRDKIGIECKVLRTLLPETQLPDPEYTLACRAPEQRQNGFITLVNPSLEKGATLFARLVLMAYKFHPEWTFLAVEGRMNDEQWRKAGLDLSNQPNVFWIPNQKDMRRVYARTSILLFPSFWIEAAGRVGVEAQLGGIPVLGSNHAGIPELLNGGGFLFDIPERCRQKYQNIPTEAEVRPWLDTLYKLMDDEDYYREAVNRALDRGKWIHPDNIRPKVVQMFENYAEGRNLTPPLDPNQKPKKPKTHAPIVKEKSVGRNDPCPCGSGKKAKNCCGTEGPSPEKRAIDIKALMGKASTREPSQEEIKLEREMFQRSLGYEPDLAKPQTFNEKVARRKLFGEVADAPVLQDKWQVRELVQSRAGASVLPEVYQVIAQPQELSWQDLPAQFSIVPAHLGPQMKMVPDKDKENPTQVQEQCRRLLQSTYGQKTNEYWYGQIDPRVLFTQFLQNGSGQMPQEYKLFVFHGRCEFIQVDKQESGPKRTIYNRSWEVQPVRIQLPQGSVQDRPNNLDEMIQVAESLGQGYDFFRVNLCVVEGKVYFSSITLAPGAGWERFGSTEDPQASY